MFSGLSIFVGAYDISIAGLLNGNTTEISLLFISRFPRLMAIIFTGIGMSVAGLIMQQLVMNKFMSPSTGATISSAQFGVMLTILIFSEATLVHKTLIAFVTSILGTFMFVYFVQKLKYKDVVMVPLIGIMFGNIIRGITNYFAIRHDLLQSLTVTLVGDFSNIIRGRYEIVFLVVPLLIVAFIYANHFNIVGLGENFAKNLGVKYELVLFSGLAICSLITASIVVTVGTISYIGLIVPNIISMFRGDKIRASMIDTALFGALFVLVCDVIGRLIIHPYELPINLIAGIVGSITFIILMYRKLNPKYNHSQKGA